MAPSCSSARLSMLADRILRAKFSLDPTVLKPGLGRMTFAAEPERDVATPPLIVLVFVTGDGKLDAVDEADEAVTGV
jgi:hypothetical protein